MRKIFLSLLAVVAISSCNFLDVDESTGKKKEDVYVYFDRVKQVVTDIYGYLPSDWGTLGGALREAATDNAVYVSKSNAAYGFFDGRWSPLNTIDDVWASHYKAIRSANDFLESFSLDNFEEFRHHPNILELIKATSYYPYEVRFIRAFLYFELIKRYKNVPLVKTVLTEEEANEVVPSSFDDVVEFIVTECEEAAANLPDSYASVLGKETGRITKGACMALKSRVLLYAASPLFNGGKNVAAKYERAAAAAWDLIEYAQKTKLYSITKGELLWGTGNEVLNSKQLILERRGGNSNSFEKNNFPIGYEGGQTGNCPTQNLVDAFECSDGTEFNWDDPAEASAPYENRDPRLAQTVLFNGASWQDEKVETYWNGRNGQPLVGASLTGYYLKKYLDESVSLKAGNATSKPHHYILFRYAEILLNYAEAMSEWKGPGYSDSKYTMTPIQAVNMVRTRSGAKPIPETMSADEFRNRYRNERRIELAFEDHRFWDIRRWKIGPETTEIYGIKIIKEGDDMYRYEKVLLEKRTWEDKMYLYPISRWEIRKNGNLKQNPGW